MTGAPRPRTAADPADLEIFLAVAPGLEAALAGEARALGFRGVAAAKGGVTVRGGWPEVWRANLQLRGASRVVVRIASFRALHLAQLDKRARRVPWAEVLRPDVPVQVEATCRDSRIYHSGAAAERVARAIREELGAPVSETAAVTVRVRMEDDLCIIGVDTSGELLHKRGFKEAVGKAPMRETLAALLLRQCGYSGTEPVVDPMCGSGTFIIEAAEIAAGLAPGRARAFAFQQLATFDAVAWAALVGAAPLGSSAASTHAVRAFGSDRDAGAIAMSRANAERAGVASMTAFEVCDIGEVTAPDGPPGLVIVNPPYGARIGETGELVATYRTLGAILRARFALWRVGLVTSEPALAKATGLPFEPPGAPIAHGGLRITLYRTGPLPAHA